MLIGAQATLADIVDLGVEAMAAIGLFVADRLVPTTPQAPGIQDRGPIGDPSVARTVRSDAGRTTVVSMTTHSPRHDHLRQAHTGLLIMTRRGAHAADHHAPGGDDEW
jgi:hypothetical protein